MTVPDLPEYASNDLRDLLRGFTVVGYCTHLGHVLCADCRGPATNKPGSIPIHATLYGLDTCDGCKKDIFVLAASRLSEKEAAFAREYRAAYQMAPSV